MKRGIVVFMIAWAAMSWAQEKYVGGDMSALQLYEDNNVAYYDRSNRVIPDVLQYVKSEKVGWNSVRVRLFVNPSHLNGDGDPDPQVCQDLAYVTRFCQRVKAEGMTLMLDFHYSDTWADPANQWIPAGWATLTDEELKDTVYHYTKQSLEALVAANATPDFIQIGNEISYGMLWSAEVNRSDRTNRCFSNSPEEYWDRFRALLTEASAACREVCPDAQIIIHTERAGKPNALADIYARLASVDYDVIGLSYYPFWHNSIEVLAQSLNKLATDFPDKPVQIVETAYYYQWQPAIGEGIDYDFSSRWPITPAGQKAYIQDLNAELRLHDNVNGLYWWFPEENGNGPDNAVLMSWINRGLWNDNNHKALPGLYALQGFINEETAIEGVYQNSDEEAVYYDLLGQPIAQPTKGSIVIEKRGGTAVKVYAK